MSLNFKLLKRSFSLRNNVTDDKDDNKVSNLLKESLGFNYSKIDHSYFANSLDNGAVLRTRCDIAPCA